VTTGAGVEDRLRALAPQVLGALVRRHGQFDACEDAVQEALLAAARQWPQDGVPDDPRAWLLTVAGRRLTDAWRSESARRAREESAVAAEPAGAGHAPGADVALDAPGEEDDTLTLLLLCCHPELSAPSQVALTLRAVGGLGTAEIASAFLVPEATMAQRISRAKARIRATGTTFPMAAGAEREERLRVVLHVLYLIFNEGYAATSGPDLQRAELTVEAIRLTRAVRTLLPHDGEVEGLLALMLLTDARRPARLDRDGELVLLEDQDRSLWDAEHIAEGLELSREAAAGGPGGPYTVQARIAAVHAEAASAAETEWERVVRLYEWLVEVAPGPVAELNRAAAVAMRDGPEAGLELIEAIEGLDDYRPLHGARADLLARLGRNEEAAKAYERALSLDPNPVERRFLERRLATLR